MDIAYNWQELCMKMNKETEENTLNAYFRQIQRSSLLSFDEELELSRRIQNGDEIARHKLIEANLRLVVKIAKSYVTADVNFLDVVQEGNLGLIKAASKYDYKKNVRFSTYAAWWIKQSIVRALSKKRRTIRLPHRKEELLKKIQKTYYLLNQELSRKPSIEEISHELNEDSEAVAALVNSSGTVFSLDSTFSDDSGTLMDIYEDKSYDPDEELMKKSFREETMKFLEHLLEKEKQILLYRFSFYGGEKHTLKHIGEEMGISPETVRQIEIRAIKKLREHAVELKEYIYN